MLIFTCEESQSLRFFLVTKRPTFGFHMGIDSLYKNVGQDT